jgi:hypothetical protein
MQKLPKFVNIRKISFSFSFLWSPRTISINQQICETSKTEYRNETAPTMIIIMEITAWKIRDGMGQTNTSRCRMGFLLHLLFVNFNFNHF